MRLLHREVIGASKVLPQDRRARQFDMLWFVPLIAALVPLLITPGALSYFDITPKIALLLVGTALMLSQVRANISDVRTLMTTKAGTLLTTLLAAEWTAFAIATIVSTNRRLSLYGGSWRRLGLIPETGLLVFTFIAAGWLAARQDRVRILLRATVGAGTIAACYGIAQYFGWDPLLPAAAYEVGEGVLAIVRPPGTLGHADYFAAWLVVVLFLALALTRLETRWQYRTAAMAAVPLMALAILMSGTRAAMLGAALGFVVFVLIQRQSVWRRGIVIGLACAAAVTLLFFSPAGLKLRARLHWSLEDARGGARLMLWRDSLHMSAPRPLAGFGPETFGTEFPRFESLELASRYPDFHHESPHNIFLDALTAQGTLGLLALLGFIGLSAWSVLQACRSGHVLGPPLAAALAALLVTQQFTVFVFTTSLYFHLLVAVLVVVANSPWKNASAPVPTPRLALVPVGLAILVFLGYTARLLFADAALAVVWRRVAAADIPGASATYHSSVEAWQLPGTTSDLNYSLAMQQAATHSPIFRDRLTAAQQALDAGIRAVSTSEDRQNAWYNLAMLLAAKNDAPGAERALRSAIAWAPRWFKPHWALARLLALTGHPAEAAEEARIAYECDGGHDAEVADTWKQLQGLAR